ncbi:MAG: hypothetical protein ABIF01_05040, partial [Candidatus Micrarchaeota archaeon]
MEITVAASSIAGKREGWIEVRAEKAESDPKPDIKLELKKHRNPVVRSKFEFTKGEFGAEAARLWFTCEIVVEVEMEKGFTGKLLGKDSEKLPAASLEIEFVSLFRGSKLEIENLQIPWDESPAIKTIPKKDLER